MPEGAGASPGPQGLEASPVPQGAAADPVPQGVVVDSALKEAVELMVAIKHRPEVVQTPTALSKLSLPLVSTYQLSMLHF